MRFNIIKNDYETTNDFYLKIKNSLDLKKDWILDEKEPEIVFVLGGDGTFLKAVQMYSENLNKIKFFPVKFGGIGFYTNKNKFESEDIFLNNFLNYQNYEESDYYLLDLNIDDNEKRIALNEAKIINSVITSRLEIYINNVKLEDFKGTGLSFSTPSGSTGFAKSIGGAIIYPEAKLYQMQEIAPVSTTIFRTINSPIIFSDKEKISIINKSNDQKFKTNIIIDAYELIESFNKIEIKMSDKKVTVIMLKCEKQVNKATILNDIFVNNKKNNG